MVSRNPCHRRCRFVSSPHLKRAVCSTEGIRFVIGEEPYLPGSRIDHPNRDVPRISSQLQLNVGDVGAITGGEMCRHSRASLPTASETKRIVRTD